MNYKAIAAKVWTNNEDFYRHKEEKLRRLQEKQKKEEPSRQQKHDHEHVHVLRAIHPEAIIAEKNNAAIEDILKAKRDGLAENQFTSDLKIVTGANGALMQQIMQGIQQQQRTRSPVGASQSKSNHLLRNTFSQEVYDEFLAYKKEMKNQKQEKRVILHHQQKAKEKLMEVAFKKASISPQYFKK